MGKLWNHAVDAEMGAVDAQMSGGFSNYTFIKRGDEMYYLDSVREEVIAVKITDVEDETDNCKAYFAESIAPPASAKPQAYDKFGLSRNPKIGQRYKFITRDLGVILFLDFGTALSQNRRLIKRKSKDPSYVYPGQRNVNI